ncbi:hypothetical protein CEXT_433391 [Caerostris extrusa]|uniref:Uncharacterized protein n=1 Tax=Caerostris extrusa TaxID=172846 RepID=A0AAV4UVV4_CAEEX|nr:hypothetical protein CEXT_433391 [Caerostris extrusa]
MKSFPSSVPKLISVKRNIARKNAHDRKNRVKWKRDSKRTRLVSAWMCHCLGRSAFDVTDEILAFVQALYAVIIRLVQSRVSLLAAYGSRDSAFYSVLQYACKMVLLYAVKSVCIRIASFRIFQ